MFSVTYWMIFEMSSKLCSILIVLNLLQVASDLGLGRYCPRVIRFATYNWLVTNKPQYGINVTKKEISNPRPCVRIRCMGSN